MNSSEFIDGWQPTEKHFGKSRRVFHRTIYRIMPHYILLNFFVPASGCHNFSSRQRWVALIVHYKLTISHKWTLLLSMLLNNMWVTPIFLRRRRVYYQQMFELLKHVFLALFPTIHTTTGHLLLARLLGCSTCCMLCGVLTD